MVTAAEPQTEKGLSGLDEPPRFLARLASILASLDTHILPLLTQVELAENWYVIWRNDIAGGSLQIFVWTPGTETRGHDHSSWAAFHYVIGSMFKERYERLDDGSQFERANLHNICQIRCGGKETGFRQCSLMTKASTK